MSSEEKIIRVGSRKSELALIQTKHVIARLQKLFPAKKFEIHTMSTIGDRVLNISLPKIGEKSLFTRDLEEALRTGGVDFVVHSLKDLPTALPTGMAIGAVLERDDARDALVLRQNFKGHTISTLPKGSVIGTSSLRRTAQIKRRYPHLVVCDIRGNLNTRLAKLDAHDSKFSGIILAQAGLVRMGWEERISQVLEPTDLLYAVGQGALAVECRGNDLEILSMLQKLMCFPTMCRILAERSFLKTLGGGCSAPVAVWSVLDGDIMEENSNYETAMSLVGAVWSLNGCEEIRDKLSCVMALKARDIDCDSDTNDNEITFVAQESGKGNGNDTDNGNGNMQDEPAPKRLRLEKNSPTGSSRSPPVINDDAEVEDLSSSYDIQELIEKHIDLAKRCPIIGHEAQTFIGHSANGTTENGNSLSNVGGGDAPPILDMHCPLPIDVGQDFMGQCPFVSNEAKVSLASVGKCPLTKDNTSASTQKQQQQQQENNNIHASADEVDRAKTNATKCPFSNMQNHKGNETLNAKATANIIDPAHAKCPFLQKTVQMFDYDKEDKPKPNEFPVLIEDFEHIFCGLYHHSCYNRDFYVQSEKLGRQLAEELIKKGALDIMKVAQAEIHSTVNVLTEPTN